MNNLSVLYVEDDDIVRENFALMLQRYFSIIIVASDGEQALQLYLKKPPDIAILDISIPFLSGLQLASKIRAKDKKIEIIMLTAFTDQEKLLHAVNLQLFAYLVKPISQSKLDSCLQAVIKKLSINPMISLNGCYKWDKKNELLFYCCRYYIASIIFENIIDKDIDYNSLVQIISRLKSKLKKKYNNPHFFIQNTYGAGYKIVLDE
ncbi:MAG: response regulator [Pseudomonadota bacterium]